MLGRVIEVVRPEEQVQLRGQVPARLLLEHREVQDDEHVVVVLVQLGALVARVDVLVVERVEVEPALEPVAVGGAWRLDVDPAQAGGLDDVGIGFRLGTTSSADPAGRRFRTRRFGRGKPRVGTGDMVRATCWA